MKKLAVAIAVALVALTTMPIQAAEINVGITVGATGPGASLGIPYKNTFAILPAEIAGQKVNYIILDDATDPSNAVKNVRRLVNDDHVDIIIGSTSVPAALAVSDVAQELKTPQIALSPLPGGPVRNPWVFAVAQPIGIMMSAVGDHMKANGTKKVAFIGFSDAWGDLVLKGLQQTSEANELQVVTEERYGRTDTSVSGQVLKIVSVNPDAVTVGGSGTPAALPHATLRERGFQGPIYHNHGVINPDFLRVGGKAVEGAIAPTGPVMVAQQLPDDNPIRDVALEFIKAYEAKYGAGTVNAFAAYSYDAYKLLEAAIPSALEKAEPGTPQFRQALRDSLENLNEVVGTHAVYNMSAQDHTGVDGRAAVLVRVDDGKWKLLEE